VPPPLARVAERRRVLHEALAPAPRLARVRTAAARGEARSWPLLLVVGALAGIGFRSGLCAPRGLSWPVSLSVRRSRAASGSGISRRRSSSAGGKEAIQDSHARALVWSARDDPHVAVADAFRAALPIAAAMLEQGFGAELKPEERIRQALATTLREQRQIEEVTTRPEWRPAMPWWHDVPGGKLGGFDLACEASWWAPRKKGGGEKARGRYRCWAPGGPSLLENDGQRAGTMRSATNDSRSVAREAVSVAVRGAVRAHARSEPRSRGHGRGSPCAVAPEGRRFNNAALDLERTVADPFLVPVS
jgi:hypothetical protein